MNKIFLFLSLLIFYHSASALEGECFFEEVYKNGDMQFGKVWYQNKNLRYQYSNKNLFTIIKNKQGTFIINNNNLVFREYEDSNFIAELNNIIAKKPYVDGVYYNKEAKFVIERQNDDRELIKRISINSSQLNLSIYFKDCIKSKVDDRYFKHSPFFKSN